MVAASLVEAVITAPNSKAFPPALMGGQYDGPDHGVETGGVAATGGNGNPHSLPS
jgi:hypothetical protein